MNEEVTRGIDPSSITTEDALTTLLATMGFKSRPIPIEDNIVIMRDPEYAGQPQRYIIAQDNPGLQCHAIVSIEEGGMCIYYYQFNEDLFEMWEKFTGTVEIEQIRKTILAATNLDEVDKRFYS